ncbi:MAG: tetratricopeptide repeat protein, partial [Cyanobacteria bacterium J06560_2]
RALAIHKNADELRHKGEWDAAIVLYQDAVHLNPDFFWSHHSLGDCYKKVGDQFSAIFAYRQAIERDPSFVWSHYSLGESLEHLEQWADAAQSYRQAQKIEPDNLQIPPRLANVLQQQLKNMPREVELYQELAVQLVAQEKIADAISTYQMALQIRPDNHQVALALSQLLSESDPTQASILLDRGMSTIVTSSDVGTVEDLSDITVVADLLRYTHLFDPIYYRATHPEIAALDDSALLQHYIEQGSAAGFSPNPLFDDQFYCEQQPEVIMKQLNPLAHYHCFGYKNGIDPHPFFRARFYRELHADVAATDINPLEHYLAYGAQEGRAAFAAEQFSHVLESDTPIDAPYLQSLRDNALAESTMTAPRNIGVYCNSLGNYFITEIADYVADALSYSGHTVTRLDEQDTPSPQLDSHWVIAPHEFFYLGDGHKWAQKQDWLENAILVNVEQPQTTWFSKAFHFLRHTKVIFDINVKSTAIMHALGLPAYWLPLGDLENYASLEAAEQLPDLLSMRSLSAQVRECLPPIDAPLVERPLDIHFIGTLNQRREEFFAKSASWLSKYRCFLHMPSMGVPLLKGQDQALDTQAVIGISRRSQILLNVHRDPLPYFEWHRIVFHGLWQNTLVVTEPCHDIPGLIAGEHFIACPLSEMAERVEWLLRSMDGRETAERVRQAGHQVFKARFAGAQIMNNALAISEAALNRTGAERGANR